MNKEDLPPAEIFCSDCGTKDQSKFDNENIPDLGCIFCRECNIRMCLGARMRRAFIRLKYLRNNQKGKDV